MARWILGGPASTHHEGCADGGCLEHNPAADGDRSGMYPGMRWVHVFVDNAEIPSRRQKLVQAWLAAAGPPYQTALHFPAYCPHLNPIERLWGLMHRHTTHNKVLQLTFTDFSSAMLHFLPRDDAAQELAATYCDEVTDNFRIINPNEVPDHRVSGYSQAQQHNLPHRPAGHAPRCR